MQTKRVVDRSERLTLTAVIQVPETWRLFSNAHTHIHTNTNSMELSLHICVYKISCFFDLSSFTCDSFLYSP